MASYSCSNAIDLINSLTVIIKITYGSCNVQGGKMMMIMAVAMNTDIVGIDFSNLLAILQLLTISQQIKIIHWTPARAEIPRPGPLPIGPGPFALKSIQAQPRLSVGCYCHCPRPLAWVLRTVASVCLSALYHENGLSYQHRTWYTYTSQKVKGQCHTVT